ncbi:MAG: hypothetical protein ACE5MG_04295 [Candidatus Methylomirabilales bacterium]
MGKVVRLQGTDRERPPDERRHPWLLGRKGGTRTRVLLLILLGILVVHVGSQVISAYVDYLALFDTVQQVVRDIAFLKRQGVEEGKERILAKAQELQLPLSDRQVILRVDEKTILAQVWWWQPIGVLDFTYPYPFEIEETRPLR